MGAATVVPVEVLGPRKHFAAKSRIVIAPITAGEELALAVGAARLAIVSTARLPDLVGRRRLSWLHWRVQSARARD